MVWSKKSWESLDAQMQEYEKVATWDAVFSADRLMDGMFFFPDELRLLLRRRVALMSAQMIIRDRRCLGNCACTTGGKDIIRGFCNDVGVPPYYCGACLWDFHCSQIKGRLYGSAYRDIIHGQCYSESFVIAANEMIQAEREKAIAMALVYLVLAIPCSELNAKADPDLMSGMHR
jgi:hypothetical protein